MEPHGPPDSVNNPYQQTQPAMISPANSSTFGLLKQFFTSEKSGKESGIKGLNTSVRTSLGSQENAAAFKKHHVCFAPTSQDTDPNANVLHCMDCQQLICGICQQQGNKTHAHHTVKKLTDVSQHVVKAFTDQLDEVRLLQGQLSKLHHSDPFSMRKSKSKVVDSSWSNEEHARIFRLGQDMIDNVFDQMHELIDKARSSLREQFKEQLAKAFQVKFKHQTATLSSHISKLEDYLATVTPELELLRSQGKHQILVKQLPKTEELRKKTRVLKDKVSQSWQKSGSLIDASDLQITLKQQLFRHMCRKMVQDCVSINILSNNESQSDSEETTRHTIDEGRFFATSPTNQLKSRKTTVGDTGSKSQVTFAPSTGDHTMQRRNTSYANTLRYNSQLDDPSEQQKKRILAKIFTTSPKADTSQSLK